MGQTYDEIVKRIDEHLGKSGKRYYSEFYIGISNNARERLFEQHHVDMNNSWWIYDTAQSTEVARDVEKHYLELGMRGGTGGGKENSNMVYCYVVTPTTTE
ncbi:MAG: hypothetical protein HDR82_08565 [Bacteroides sp.]|nr:hypothetical protein [Bacteroides sp.]